MLLRFVAGLALISGCDSLVPAPDRPPDLRQTAPTAPPRLRRPDMAVTPDLAPPALIEIELRGKVDASGAPAGKLVVVVTDGPCFQPGSHYIGSMPTRPGQKYFVEVFPPRGTRLDVCAALVVNGMRTTPWHGHAPKAPIIAAGVGDVMINDMDIKVAKSLPITLPDDLKIE